VLILFALGVTWPREPGHVGLTGHGSGFWQLVNAVVKQYDLTWTLTL